MRAWILVWSVCGLAAMGCSHYGDSTWGDERRSEWRIDDGLCPGTEGGCGMETPVAAGVEVSVDADVTCAERYRDSSGELTSDCSLTAFDVSVGGAAELRAMSHDVNDGRIDVDLVTVGSGEVELDLRDAAGPYDRITFDVREAAGIECGRVGASGARWDMPGLDESGSYAVSTAGADRVSNVELGCRLVDDRGLPLLSGAAIEWQIVEGAELATVDDGGLFGEARSSGARVYVRLSARGTIRLEARFGELARELVIEVD